MGGCGCVRRLSLWFELLGLQGFKVRVGLRGLEGLDWGAILKFSELGLFLNTAHN